MIAFTKKGAIKKIVASAARGKKGLDAIEAKRKALVIAEDILLIDDDKSLEKFFDDEYMKLHHAQHRENLRLGLVNLPQGKK